MKFCFFGDIIGALKGETPGGGELQIALLARSLALHGETIVVIDPSCNEAHITPEGIKVIGVPQWHSGISLVRFFSYRAKNLFKLLIEQEADVYYSRMWGHIHIWSYLAAKRVGGKFILSLASDLDVLGFFKRFRYRHSQNLHPYFWFANNIPSEAIYPYLLRHADILLVQHKGQEQLLRRKHLQCQIFKNIFDFAKVSQVNLNRNSVFVTVGAITTGKGVHELYNIARSAPGKKFQIIGQPRGKGGLYLCEKLSQLKNVELLGKLDHRATINLIAEAKALISTSPLEGFPNVFLEAWAVGTPVISLNVDPGGVIEEHHLGYYCRGERDNLLNVLDFSDDVFDRELLIRYVQNNHSFDDAAERFLALLQN